MKRVTLGSSVGIVTIFAVNGLLGFVSWTCTAGNAVVLGLGSVIAAVVALRMWKHANYPARSAEWCFFAAVVLAIIGALLYWLDIFFGFIVLPIPANGEILDAVVNPLAVMISAAFLPFGASVAIATAVRAVLLQDEVSRPDV